MDQTTLNSSLKILYWNTRSIIQRKQELQILIQKYDMCVCVETWLKPSEDFNFTGYVTFRKDRVHSRGGGIIIIIRKNLAYLELKHIRNIDKSVEICEIKITNVTPSLDLIACYRIPGNTLSMSNWETVISNVKHNKPTVLVGDFNAHNVKWNCLHTDSNGERLDQRIEDNNDLFLHNVNSNTHIDFYRKKLSII